LTLVLKAENQYKNEHKQKSPVSLRCTGLSLESWLEDGRYAISLPVTYEDSSKPQTLPMTPDFFGSSTRAATHRCMMGSERRATKVDRNKEDMVFCGSEIK
jgi:hypothetical protein